MLLHTPTNTTVASETYQSKLCQYKEQAVLFILGAVLGDSPWNSQEKAGTWGMQEMKTVKRSRKYKHIRTIKRKHFCIGTY
jgi:hypothetical protein